MRINRGFLYAGVFLVATGGVVVAADIGAVDTAALADAVRLWPLVPIAIGVSIVLRRSQFSLPTGLLAAAVPGLVLGGAFAVIPRFVGDCGARGDPAIAQPQQGTFDGAASISLTTGCGSLTVNTAPGNSWALQADNTAGRMPAVSSSARLLTVGSPGDGGWHLFDGGRDRWNLTLPTTNIDALSLISNANRSNIALPGAKVGRLAVTANASDIVLDASAASIGTLSGAVNMGSLSVHLPTDSDLAGSVRVGAGRLQVCSPPGVGLRITSSGLPRQISVGGLQQNGSSWQSADYVSATHRADLEIRVNLGTVEINPIGGCR